MPRVTDPLIHLLAHLFIVAAASVIGGCSDPTAPPQPRLATRAAGLAAQPLATVRWNEVARALVTKYKTDPAARPYAAVSLAAFAAIEDLRAHGIRSLPATRAASRTAAASVLLALYPLEGAFLSGLVQSDVAADGESGPAVATGDAAGAAAAARVVAWLQNDGSSAPWTGQVPVGPGLWFSNTPPVTPMLGHVRPYFMTSGDQFRPPAPPAFGSPAFQAALAEVRQLSDNRTPAQAQFAQQWAYSSGTYRLPGYWNQLASDLIVARDLDEWRAAHALALVNMAMMDAAIACFDAKYTYWYIRPTMADPAITLAIPLSNHPSYPSSHSCTAGAGYTALASLFGHGDQLRALADEIGESRIVGGVHYRFDITVGTQLGRTVAQLAARVDRTAGLVSVLP